MNHIDHRPSAIVAGHESAEAELESNLRSLSISKSFVDAVRELRLGDKLTRIVENFDPTGSIEEIKNSGIKGNEKVGLMRAEILSHRQAMRTALTKAITLTIYGLTSEEVDFPEVYQGNNNGLESEVVKLPANKLISLYGLDGLVVEFANTYRKNSALE